MRIGSRVALAVSASGILVASFLAVGLTRSPAAVAATQSVAWASRVEGMTVTADDVSVYLEPASGVEVDQTQQYTKLASSAFTLADNRVSIVLAPSAVPASYVAEGGLVTFTVFVADAATAKFASGSGTARIVRDGAGQRVWVDPEADYTMTTASGGAPVRTISTAPAPAPDDTITATTNSAAAKAFGGVGGGNTLPTPEPRRGKVATATAASAGSFCVKTVGKQYRPAAVASTFPVGSDTAQFTYGSARGTEHSASFGVAGRGQGIGAKWEQIGTKTRTSSWELQWLPTTAQRQYRVEVEYHHKQWRDPLWCEELLWEEWVPIREHPTPSHRTVSRPNFTHCRVYGSTVNFTRSNANGSAFTTSAGVDFADVIGIGLSTRRQYSSTVTIKYHVTAGNRICGNNRDPGYAGKIMERIPAQNQPRCPVGSTCPVSEPNDVAWDLE